MSGGKDVTFTMRIDAELRDAFVAACKARDVSAAQIVRAAMRDFIAAHNAPKDGGQ